LVLKFGDPRTRLIDRVKKKNETIGSGPMCVPVPGCGFLGLFSQEEEPTTITGTTAVPPKKRSTNWMSEGASRRTVLVVDAAGDIWVVPGNGMPAGAHRGGGEKTESGFLYVKEE
jgi:hypothetical protein